MLQIVMVDTGQIRPYEQNPRQNEATIAKLMELIPKVGFNVPLVLDHQNVIVKGHTRWEAGRRLGMPQLPCVYTDAAEEAVRLDRLADNKVSEFSAWDTEMLQSELAALSVDFNLGSLNFKLADRAFDTGGATLAAPPSNGAAAPAAEGESTRPFITAADVAATVSQPQHDYSPVNCPKCGQKMMVRR